MVSVLATVGAVVGVYFVIFGVMKHFEANKEAKETNKEVQQ